MKKENRQKPKIKNQKSSRRQKNFKHKTFKKQSPERTRARSAAQPKSAGSPDRPAAGARETWRPANLLYPVPAVLVSCADENGQANVMTAAWAGTVCSDPVMVSVSIRPSRYSHDIIAETGEFVINLTNRPLARATDWCGVKSGRDVDKFAVMDLTPLKLTHVKAPGIAQSPVCLACKVEEILPLGSHDMFLAEVVETSVDARYIDDTGRLDLARADLIAYAHGAYVTLGEVLGRFGYTVRKKPQKNKHRHKK